MKKFKINSWVVLMFFVLLTIVYTYHKQNLYQFILACTLFILVTVKQMFNDVDYDVYKTDDIEKAIDIAIEKVFDDIEKVNKVSRFLDDYNKHYIKLKKKHLKAFSKTKKSNKK